MAINSLNEFLDASVQKDLSPEVFVLEISHMLEIKWAGLIEGGLDNGVSRHMTMSAFLSRQIEQLQVDNSGNL